MLERGFSPSAFTVHSVDSTPTMGWGPKHKMRKVETTKTFLFTSTLNSLHPCYPPQRPSC